VPRGHPDYGQAAPATTIGRVADLGEIAVRLGSIVTADRRGEVVWMDDFEAAVLNKWVPTAQGTGSSVALTTANVRNGAQAVRLTAGSDGNRRAFVDHYQPLPAASRLGIEVSWCATQPIESLVIDVDLATGGATHSYQVIYRYTQQDLRVFDAAGGYTTVATGISYNEISTLFNVLKLVFDFAADTYVRLVWQSVEYDISGVATYTEVSAAAPAYQIRIEVTGRAGSNDDIDVDDVILTQNEP